MGLMLIGGVGGCLVYLTPCTSVGWPSLEPSSRTYLPHPRPSLAWNLMMVAVALWLPSWATGVLTSRKGLEFAKAGCGGWVFGEVGEGQQHGTIQGSDGWSGVNVWTGVSIQEGVSTRRVGVRRSLPGLTVALAAPGECQTWWLKFQAIPWNSGRVCAMSMDVSLNLVLATADSTSVWSEAVVCWSFPLWKPMNLDYHNHREIEHGLFLLGIDLLGP